MSMIALDRRIGSEHLYAPLLAGSLNFNPPPEIHMGTLEFGDACFFGHGPEDSLLHIGLEVKKLSDLIQCIQDGRFAGRQLRGLRTHYAVTYVIVQGLHKRGEQGEILAPIRGKERAPWYRYPPGTSKWEYRPLRHWIMSMELAGCVFRYSSSDEETAEVILDEWSYWNKSWDEHDAAKTFDNSDPVRGGTRKMMDRGPEIAFAPEPSLVQKVAKEFPGIGWTRSEAVAQHFGSVLDMVNAEVKQWVKIPGIGLGTAKKVWAAVRKGGAE